MNPAAGGQNTPQDASGDGPVPGGRDAAQTVSAPRVVWDPRTGQVLAELARHAVFGDFVGDVLPHQVELVDAALPRQQAARLRREILDALNERDEARKRISGLLAYLDELAAVEDAPYPLTITHDAVRRLLTEDQQRQDEP